MSDILNTDIGPCGNCYEVFELHLHETSGFYLCETCLSAEELNDREYAEEKSRHDFEDEQRNETM
jgi:hypothetical protein